MGRKPKLTFPSEIKYALQNELRAFVFAKGGLRQAAEALGISHSCLWRWVNGKSKPSRLARQKVAGVLAISVA